MNNNKPKNTRPIKVKGTRDNAAVKGIPRKDILAAFVSRLDLDTTSDELCAFLSDGGLKDGRCRRIKGNEGTQYKTAAFFVSCSAECHDLFYNSALWPEGAEVRDWIFS